MGKFRNFIFIALLVLLFGEVLIVFPSHLGRHRDDPPAKNPQDTANAAQTTGVAEQKMEGVHLVESQKGSRDWELFSQDAEGNQGFNEAKLHQVRVLFYNKERTEFVVTGQVGDIDTKTKNMKIHGDVVTTSTNGYVFRSEDVEYDSKNRRIVSPGRVFMQGPRDKDGEGMKVEGTRMIADVEKSRMQISSAVKASKALRGGRFMRLTSRAADFSGKNRQAHFEGDVSMEYDRVKLEAPDAVFTGAEEGEFLSRARFSGGIKVTDAQKFATSENLDLDLIANKFTFSGQPKVYQNNDELSGERIVFLDGGKKVKVEKVNANVEKLEHP